MVGSSPHTLVMKFGGTSVANVERIRNVAAHVKREVDAGNKVAVPSELAKWNRAGGRVLAGLVRRRKAEGLMFAGKVDDALKVARR